MTYNPNELLTMPTGLLMRLEAVLEVIVIVETSVLVFMIIVLAILSWVRPDEIRRPDGKSRGVDPSVRMPDREVDPRKPQACRDAIKEFGK